MAANRSELLATWYLRFNGYFTTEDFSVHPDFKKQPGGTDADILAVHFPFSREFQRHFVFERDDDLIVPDAVDFVICEVKDGLCSLNENSWLNAKRENVEYAMRWMGMVKDESLIDHIAKELYETGECLLDSHEESLAVHHLKLRFVCFGSKINEDLAYQRPKVKQITHRRVVGFLMARFNTNCRGIIRSNWGEEIQEFAKLCKSRNEDDLLQWLLAR